VRMKSRAPRSIRRYVGNELTVPELEPCARAPAPHARAPPASWPSTPYPTAASGSKRFALIGGPFFAVNTRLRRRGLWRRVAKMEMQQGITSGQTAEPPIEPTSIRASDRLHALGRLLYGEHGSRPWRKISKSSTTQSPKWASGTYELSPDHPIFAALSVLLHYHDTGIARACKVMDQNRV
jgi:hypothetical protein